MIDIDLKKHPKKSRGRQYSNPENNFEIGPNFGTKIKISQKDITIILPVYCTLYYAINSIFFNPQLINEALRGLNRGTDIVSSPRI